MQMYSIHTAHTLFAYVTLQQPVQKIKLFVLCLNGELLVAALETSLVGAALETSSSEHGVEYGINTFVVINPVYVHLIFIVSVRHCLDPPRQESTLSLCKTATLKQCPEKSVRGS